MQIKLSVTYQGQKNENNTAEQGIGILSKQHKWKMTKKKVLEKLYPSSPWISC